MATPERILKKMIRRKKIRLMELAEKTGIPYKTLSGKLNERRGLRLDELIRICDAAEIDLEDLRKEWRQENRRKQNVRKY